MASVPEIVLVRFSDSYTFISTMEFAQWLLIFIDFRFTFRSDAGEIDDVLSSVTFQTGAKWENTGANSIEKNYNQNMFWERRRFGIGI